MLDLIENSKGGYGRHSDRKGKIQTEKGNLKWEKAKIDVTILNACGLVPFFSVKKASLQQSDWLQNLLEKIHWFLKKWGGDYQDISKLIYSDTWDHVEIKYIE